MHCKKYIELIIQIIQSWIFKSFNDDKATTDATATASAANKTGIFKSFSDATATASAANKTWIFRFPETSIEALEDHWHC